jgi:hypothetical protein
MIGKCVPTGVSLRLSLFLGVIGGWSLYLASPYADERHTTLSLGRLSGFHNFFSTRPNVIKKH